MALVPPYEPTEAQLAKIANNFTYHPPINDQVARYEVIRANFRQFAENLCRVAPESRELSLAMTALEDCCMWTNAAIARNEK